MLESGVTKLQSFGDDSFFTLTLLERVGLGTLSLAMLAVIALCVCWIARRFGFGLALLATLPIYWSFIWGAPQVYYQYYRLIFDGLPVQWVIGAPPPVLTFLALVLLQMRETLSEICQGVGFWLVLSAGFFCAKTKA